MSDPFIGEIKMFAGDFAPRGWAFCDGQLLAISQNDALFSLLGTIYGGDGRTTFGLPDLRGRVPIHEGNGPGLSTHPLGSRGGSETNSHSFLPIRGDTSATGASNSAVADASPENNMQPYLAINFIIALVGIYPSRN
jgi:microcystin-dependent protein